MQESKQFRHRFYALVLPMALQNLMSALVPASDAWMLGMLHQDALSAVSLATQIQFVLNLFYAAFTIGVSVLAAQYWGKQDVEKVERILSIGTTYSLIVSLVFFVSVLWIPQLILQLFTSDAHLIELGAKYLRAVSPTYLCMGISQIYLCGMKNTGRTLRSSLFASSAVIVNILLNGILIFGLCSFPAMGIQGAAYASVLARLVELGLVVIENNRKGIVHLPSHWWKQYDHALAKKFWQYTSPVLINELIWGGGFTMFTVILGHLGNDAIAANSIANVAKNLIACFCLGIGAGSGILIGNLLGSGALEEAKQVGDRLLRLSCFFGIVSGLLVLLVSPIIVSCSGSLTATAQGYLKMMLWICSYYMIGKSINSTLVAGIFCAGGDTKFGMLCDLFGMWGIILPLGAAAAFLLHCPVMIVYFILNLDEFVKLPAVYIHYKNYGWVKNLT